MKPIWQPEPQKPSLPCVPETAMNKLSGVDVAKTGYVGGERFAIRPFGVGIDVVLDGGAGGFGGVEEFQARLCIGRRKMLRNCHGAPRKRSACAPTIQRGWFCGS